MHWGLVTRHYKPHEVLLLDGNDAWGEWDKLREIRGQNPDVFTKGTLFVREMPDGCPF